MSSPNSPSEMTLQGELQTKFFPYIWVVISSVVFIPSNSIFVSFLGPSRYESKLWDLKMVLSSLKPPASNAELSTIQQHITDELADLQLRYSGNTTGQFEKFLTAANSELRREQIGLKYFYFIRSAIDWELIRIQPLRYVWNETEQIAWYGLLVTGVVGTSAMFKLKEDRFHGFELLKDRLKQTDTAKLGIRFHRLAKSCIAWTVEKLPLTAKFSRIPYPLLIGNLCNFFYLLGNYKPPLKRKPAR